MGRNSTWWVRSPRAPAPAPGPPRWPRGPGTGTVRMADQWTTGSHQPLHAPATAPGPLRWPRGPGSGPGRGRFGCRAKGSHVHIRRSTPRPPRRGLSVGREVPGRARDEDGSGVGPRGHRFTSAAPRPGPRAGASPLAVRSRVRPGTVRMSGQRATCTFQDPHPERAGNQPIWPIFERALPRSRPSWRSRQMIRTPAAITTSEPQIVAAVGISANSR